MSILDISDKLQVSLVELKALNLSTNIEESFYYSTTSYITKPNDTPGNIAYHSRVIGALDNSRSLSVTKGAGGGITSIGYGKIELSNIDGALDKLEHSYALTGRGVTVKTGDKAAGHANLLTVFTGVIKQVDFSNSSLLLEVQDSSSTLEVEVSKGVYVKPGGSGEPTFNTMLHGNQIPLCFGDVYNVSPAHVGKILSGELYTAKLDKYAKGNMALSGDDLVAVNDNTGSYGSVYSTISVSSGKYYAEVLSTSISSPTNAYIGVATSVSRPFTDYCGSSGNSWGYHGATGSLVNAGSSSAFGSTWNIGNHVIGIAIDGDSGNVWFSVNNSWQGGGDPATGVNPSISGITGQIFIGVSSVDDNTTLTARFASASLTGTVPTGFNSVETPVSVAELMYQVHDGPITDIPNVYSNGAVLDPGQYTKYLSEGKFQINIGSVSGATITADVQGDSSISQYNSAISIMKDILLNRVSPPTPIDTLKFDALSATYFESISIIDDAIVGAYYPRGARASEILAQFNKSFGLYSGFNRDGVYDIGIFTAPESSESIATIVDEYVIDAKMLTARAPSTSYILGYRKNYTVLTESTVAPVVLETLPDHYTFLVGKHRQEEATIYELGIRKVDSVIEPIPVGSEALYWSLLDRYPLATVGEVEETVIQDASSALLEARRRWLLYNSDTALRQRTLLSIKLKILTTGLQVNDTIHLVYPRFGLDSGKYFRVVGYKEDLSVNEVVLEIWG